MIPILYEKTETAFISNGLGRLRDCISCIVTEERNGIYECDFEYPVDGANYDLIQVGRTVGVTHDDTGDIQPFDIVSFTKPIDGIVTFHCTHISYRQSYMTVNGSGINSLADAFTLFGTATPSNPFTYNTDKTSTGYLGCADGTPRTVRQMLGGIEGSVLDAYGGEYEWDRWMVNLWSARGQYRDFTIRYGVNMLDYNEEYDSSDCYSSCIPYWTDGTLFVVGDKQTNSGITPSGREQCIPLDISDKFESQPTKAQVNSVGLSTMNSQNPTIPSQSIEVSFVRLQDMGEYATYQSLLQCRLCDTIKVIFPDFNSSGQFKIVKTEWNVLTNKYESMELGDLSVSLSEALGITNALEKASAYVEPDDYVTSRGSNGNWRYRKWNSGMIEAWGNVTRNNCAITTSSAAYGGYRTSTELTWAIPSGIFTSTPTYVTATKSGANSARVMNMHATSATAIAGYLSSSSSETINVTISFYVVQI